MAQLGRRRGGPARARPPAGELVLALGITGDIDRQTVSGAISTGTHGSGPRFGGIATQVT